jgi:hypothetical protein
MKGRSMKKITSIILLIFMFTCISGQLAVAQQPQYQDDDLLPDLFTLILKKEWEYLRDATEQLDKETGIRGEFETTPEFQARATRSRQGAIEKLNAHIKDNKLDKRIFGVWLKANLLSYDADKGVYSINCPLIIEAPYDIPTVVCAVPNNQYVEMVDSIRGGYRKASIHFKFDPDFKWKVTRNDAMTAKSAEANVYFKIHFVVNMTLENLPTKATLKIIPKTISIVNKSNKFVYWKENISRIETPREPVQMETPVIEDIEEEDITE